MQNILSPIFKNKKFLIAICLLFFLATGIIFPQIANAGVISGIAGGAGIGCAAGVAGAVAFGFFTSGVGWATIPVALGACATVGKIGAVAGGVTSVATGSAANDFDMAIIRGGATLLYNITNSVANFAAAWTSDYLQEEKIKTSILTSPGFSQGWVQVRDFTNMLVVLGFVFIGISFALRIEGYGTKKVLINLVLVALLVNFSGLLCGIIIDTSNIITIHFLKGNSNLGVNMIHDLELQSDQTNWSQLATEGAGTYLQVAVPFILSFLIIAITFFYLAVIMMVRGAIFGIFYVLSPLAFLCWVFPATKKVWSMWWENFIKWALIAAQVSFFVWVASLMSRNPSQTPISDLNVLKVNTGEILAICVLLYVAVTVARKSSAIGAGAIMGFAAGTGMSAVRKLKGASWSALKSASESRAGAATKDKATAVGEKFGLVSKGTTDQNKAKRLEGSRKRLDAIQNNQQLAKIAEQTAITHEQAQDKAVAAEILAKRKAFSTINPNKRDAVAAHATAFGISRDTFTKESPETLATSTDQEAFAKVQSDIALRDRHLFASDGEALRASQKYKPSDNEIAQAKTDLRQRKVVENALGIAPINDKDITNTLIDKAIKNEVAIGKTYEEAQQHVAKTYKPNSTEIAFARQELSQDKIKKGFAKLSGEGIGKLPGEALKSKEFIESVQTNRIAQSARFLSGQGVNDIKSHISYIQDEMRKCKNSNGILIQGKGPRYKELQDKLAEINIL